MTGQTKLGLSDPSATIPNVETDPRRGKVLNNVRIEKLIGWGGMGDIYLAFHMGLNRYVAVKIPKYNDRVVVARMLTEARSQFDLKRICGDHIVSILDVSENPEPHIVMEYVENSATIEDVIRNNPGRIFDPSHLAKCTSALKDVLIAVDKAHNHHDKDGRPTPIIHRDIKPSNVLVVDKGSVFESYIIDWGLARVGKGSNLTSDSTVMGSPVFMAPEQSKKIDLTGPKSDVFSAGLTFYYMVTGQLFYLTDEEERTIEDLSDIEVVVLVNMWWNDPERFDKRINDAPEWARPILRAALELDIEKRISMYEFISMLDECIKSLNERAKTQDQMTVQTPVMKKETSFGKKASLMLVGILLIIAGIVAVVIGTGKDEQKPKTSVSKPVVQSPPPAPLPSMKIVIRPREIPKRQAPELALPPKGHVMPSDDYIEQLFKKKFEWCLQNGYRRGTYEKMPTNHLGCMRRQVISPLFHTGHQATAILLLDQTYPYFCYYLATKYDASLRRECDRAKKDKKKYFLPVSGLQMAEYDKRIKSRIPIRNRIRRERRAWFEKKYFKKPSK